MTHHLIRLVSIVLLAAALIAGAVGWLVPAGILVGTTFVLSVAALIPDGSDQ